MNLFTELKRRNVFRVAIAYGVVAWFIIQAADIMLENFGAPGWVFKTVAGLLALGFPLVLFLSWAYELTPEGLKRDKDVRVDPEIKQQTSRKLNWATLIAAVLAIGLLVADRLVPEQATTTAPTAASENGAVPETASMDEGPDPASIAVLPFADLSPDGDQEYFSDGISEEILNVLAGVDGLRVASRTSSFVFKGERKSIPLIAEELDVAHVLEGSVRKAGDRIRVTAQLIRADDDAHLWSENYDRELSTENLFAIQDEIARAIVGALRDTLDVEFFGKAQATTRTDNLDAYELYLRAVNLRSIMSTESAHTRRPAAAVGARKRARHAGGRLRTRARRWIQASHLRPRSAQGMIAGSWLFRPDASARISGCPAATRIRQSTRNPAGSGLQAARHAQRRMQRSCSRPDSRADDPWH